MWWGAAALTAVLVVLGIVRVIGNHNKAPVRAIQHAPDRLRKTKWFGLSLEIRLVEADGTVKSTTSTALIDVGSDRVAAQVPAVLGRSDLQLVSQGHITYLSIPNDHRAAFGDARWIRVDSGNAEAAAGARIGDLPGPVAVLDALKATTKIELSLPSGSANTTRRRVAVDLQHLPHTQEGLAIYQAMIPLGRRFNVDVTLDTKGRPTDLSITVPVKDQRIEMHLVAQDVGQEVVIGIPPDSATVPAATQRDALVMAGASPP